MTASEANRQRVLSSFGTENKEILEQFRYCLLYTSGSGRERRPDVARTRITGNPISIQHSTRSNIESGVNRQQ